VAQHAAAAQYEDVGLTAHKFVWEIDRPNQARGLGMGGPAKARGVTGDPLEYVSLGACREARP
jgi:hypothetical protein